MQPCPVNIIFGSWNVEGLTESKIIALQHSMASAGCGILCIQETHRALSDYWVSEEGYLWILSGVSEESRNFTGVGIVIVAGASCYTCPRETEYL